MLKNDIFGHFLECRSFPFSGVILHNLLLRQVAHEEDSRDDQLWFQIGEHLIRLSIVEWCLVTGLSFGVDTNKKNDEMEQRLRNTYFGGVHRKINVKEFDAIFKELKFEEMDDMDALKIALFYFADRVLNAIRKHPWGLLSWEMIYESLDNALFEKDEKFKKTRLKNPDHNIEKYNLYGFTSGVQAWIYEAIGGLPSTWVVKTKNKIPCILQWKPMASLRINFAEVYSFFNDESRLGDVLQTLEPNSKESSRKYWLSVKDYLPSIPDWVLKHQPSINAMPSVTRQSDEHDDHDDIPNPIPEQRHDTYEDEVAVDDHQQRHDTYKDESRTKQFNDYIRRRLDKIDRNVYEIKSELKDFKETVVGFIDTFSKRPNKDSPTARSYAAPADYGVDTDVRNENLSTPTSLYSFYGDINGESVQVFSEVPPGVMVRRVRHPRSFFEILLGLTSMGWLGDEVWNNGDCAVDSLEFDDRLNSYLCGRQHTMSKSMTDVDMLLIPVNLDGKHWVLAQVDFRKNKVWIYDSLLTCRDEKRYRLKFKPLEVIFPRWLEYVGFYNIRPELRSADPWKVIAVRSAPQQECGTSDCGVFVLMVTMYLMFGLTLEFTTSHVEYFRKKIAVDIFNDDIVDIFNDDIVL
ncbi:hypothetical protein KPL70_020965 [Citrus sinensis]|nr:hypothetical protein KPL70_020965 [Citrus sinensis]